nr:transcription-repair coupling factor [Acidimicrobiia bacterium]
MSAPSSLRDLPIKLRDDPAVLRLLGRSSAVLSVPDHGRAYVIAGLAASSTRRPFVVAVPTTADAERLYRDLQTYLGDVELFPAWETLPFERVSPNVETMGRRMRTIHRLHHDPPAVIVAPVRALVQRLGPHLEDVQPITIHPGERRDRDDLLASLVGVGYRREEQVEHRGEVAVRGSIVD